MSISPPRIEPMPKRPGPAMSPLSIAVLALKPGQMIEVDPFTTGSQTTALMIAKHRGVKVSTRKTEQGTLKVYRLK